MAESGNNDQGGQNSSDSAGQEQPQQQQSVMVRCESLYLRKPVFGVCDQVRLKPVCSADETS